MRPVYLTNNERLSSLVFTTLKSATNRLFLALVQCELFFVNLNKFHCMGQPSWITDSTFPQHTLPNFTTKGCLWEADQYHLKLYIYIYICRLCKPDSKISKLTFMTSELQCKKETASKWTKKHVWSITFEVTFRWFSLSHRKTLAPGHLPCFVKYLTRFLYRKPGALHHKQSSSSSPVCQRR